MKVWLPILILFLTVGGLCIWDGIYTTKSFKELRADSTEIYETLLVTDITEESLQNKIFNLNKKWTKKMDTLIVSISRKDLQPISDYLQYLYAASINKNQEEALTYSRLLYYNVQGLREITGINFINFL